MHTLYSIIAIVLYSAIFILTTYVFCRTFKKKHHTKIAVKKLDYAFYTILAMAILFINPLPQKKEAPIKGLCSDKTYNETRIGFKRIWIHLAKDSLKYEVDINRIDSTTRYYALFLYNTLEKYDPTVQNNIEYLYESYHDDGFIKSVIIKNNGKRQNAIREFEDIYNYYKRTCDNITSSEYYEGGFLITSHGKYIVLAILTILAAFRTARLTADVQNWYKQSPPS